MRRRNRLFQSTRAFTIIEVATYVALISISMTMLIGFEIMTKQAVSDQTIQLQVAQQPDAVFQRLAKDVALAKDVRVLGSGMQLRVTLHDDSVVNYQAIDNPSNIQEKCLARLTTTTNGKQRVIPFPRIITHQFSMRDSGSENPLLRVSIGAFRTRLSNGKKMTTPFVWVFRPLNSKN